MFYTVSKPKVKPEQVLAYFGIEIDENNKAICPFHEETEPSLQVNEDFVFCYGCKISLDTELLAKRLLNKTTSHREVIDWLNSTSFPEAKLFHQKSEYQGPVHSDLIDYWHSCLFQFEMAPTLCKERLLTVDTIIKFKLGYRPDHDAWVIPYLHQGIAEIVQFRSRKEKDYYGLKNHQRGAFTNRDLLDSPQEYVVVLMGAFDGPVAFQDGILAVSQNGSFPFKKTEQERVKEIFSKQSLKFVVPDNTKSEFEPAETLAEWIEGEVKYFPEWLPEDVDYIDYRKLGYTAEDFKRDVLGILPSYQIKEQLVTNLLELYKVADSRDVAWYHLNWYGEGCSYKDIALSLVEHLPNERQRLYTAKTETDILDILQNPKGDW